jgi:hypothetical protein
MKKFLLALQVWEGDIEAGEDLCRLLIKLAPEGGYQAADLALVTRFDCRPFSTHLVQELQEVFSGVRLRKSVRTETGYPGGCNGVWHDVIQWVGNGVNREGLGYSAVLTTEADACPLVRDWDVRLQKAWERHGKAKVLGFWHPSPTNLGHINGNAMFDSRIFFDSTQLHGCSGNVPWDTHHAKLFSLLGWKASKEFLSLWKTSTLLDCRIDAAAKHGVVWLHGVKDRSVRAWVEKFRQ